MLKCINYKLKNQDNSELKDLLKSEPIPMSICNANPFFNAFDSFIKKQIRN